MFVRKNPGWTSPWTLVLLRANPPLGTPTDPPFTARSRVWVFQDQCVGLSGSLGVPSQKPKTRLISKCSDHGVFGIGVSWNAIGVLYASRTSVYARQLHQIRILGSVPPGLRSFRQNCFTARWVAFPTTFPTLPLSASVCVRAEPYHPVESVAGVPPAGGAARAVQRFRETDAFREPDAGRWSVGWSGAGRATDRAS